MKYKFYVVKTDKGYKTSVMNEKGVNPLERTYGSEAEAIDAIDALGMAFSEADGVVITPSNESDYNKARTDLDAQYGRTVTEDPKVAYEATEVVKAQAEQADVAGFNSQSETTGYAHTSGFQDVDKNSAPVEVVKDTTLGETEEEDDLG